MAIRASKTATAVEEDVIDLPAGQADLLVLVEPIEVVSRHPMPLTEVGASGLSYRFFKRFLDLLFCAVALPLLCIPLLLIAVAVRLSSPGPVFYREKRIGRFGKAFTIYKFRSMYTKQYLKEVLGYDECEKTQLKRRQDHKHTVDPRITGVGSFLRKSSLDELPQIFNILKGDMSLIGPRPVILDELRRYGHYVPLYEMMYPGLTGLWQVSGRNDVSYDERVQMDVFYCRKWSLYLDLVIIMRTIPAVLKGNGAY